MTKEQSAEIQRLADTDDDDGHRLGYSAARALVMGGA